MVTIKSNIEQVAVQWAKDAEKKLAAAVHRALTKTGMVGEARIKGIIEKEAYDTGRFLRSVNSVIYVSPDNMRLVIGTDVAYAIYLEHGRKPGKWPNLDALVKWVGRRLREKGVNATVNVTFDQLKEMAKTRGKKGGSTAKAKVAREHLAALYLIGRKIATKGIREKLIFKRIEDGLLAYFRSQLQTEINALQSV